MSIRPTKKQRELLSFIENFASGHGYGPSYREIMRGLGYKSVSTVATHVDNLIARGHLRKRTKSARSLEVVSEADAPFEPGEHVTPEQEKWLVSLVGKKFDEIEAQAKPDAKQIDELYVLVGTLKVLNLDSAASSFVSRLNALK